MKRFGNLWNKICSRENIEIAASNSLRSHSINKRTSSMKHFVANRKELLDKIELDLKNETYVFGPMMSFTVYEPKERIIHHPQYYPDRIYHHCLMNVINPILMLKFTADTYGSIPGRGIVKILKKLRNVLRDNPNCYYLKLDIKKFYPSVDHNVLKSLIRKIIKCKKTLKFIDATIDSHSPGLAIGIWPSLYFANLMLTPVDHYIKEVLRVKHYYRYMDDMLLILPDKKTCLEVYKKLEEQITALNLTIKNNVRIASVSKGISFVGYVFYPNYIKLRSNIKKNIFKRLNKLETKEQVRTSFSSYNGWLKWGNCKNLLKSIKSKYNL